MQNCIRILRLEETGTYIQHSFLRIQLLGSQSDGIHQMSLSTTRRTIDKHRVKLRSVRMLSNRQSHRSRKLVAVALYVCIKGELGVKLGINVFLLLNIGRHSYLLIHRILRGINIVARFGIYSLRHRLLFISSYHAIGETDSVAKISMKHLT